MISAMEARTLSVLQAAENLASAYGHRLTDQMTGEWMRGLNHPAEVIDRATAVWLASEPRFPTVADLDRLCHAEARRLSDERHEAIVGANTGPDPEGLARTARGFAVARACLSAGMTADETWEALRDAGVVGTDEALVTCQECLDQGNVFRDDGTVRPCSRCDPARYERWADGHFRKGHSCEVCRAVRGRRG